MAVDSNDAHSAGRGLRNAAPEPRVVALGGFVMGSESDRVTDVVESFSPHQGGWKKEPHLAVVTAGHCAETMHGSLYIMGGHDMRFLEHVGVASRRENAMISLWCKLPRDLLRLLGSEQVGRDEEK